MSQLTVQLFGSPSLHIAIDQRSIPVKLPRPQAEGVFFYCLDAAKPVADEELLDLVWPGRGRNALEQRLLVNNEPENGVLLFAMRSQAKRPDSEPEAFQETSSGAAS